MSCCNRLVRPRSRSPRKDTFIGTEQVRQFKFFVVIKVGRTLDIECLKMPWNWMPRAAGWGVCLCRNVGMLTKYLFI